jgi:hypothetical protein
MYVPPEQEFERAYRRALTFTRHDLFSHILSQHAVTMIDAVGCRNKSNSELIHIGVRLNVVQQNWIGLLYSALVDPEEIDGHLDAEYGNVLTATIKNFTQHIAAVVTDDKRVSFEELAGIHQLHSAMNQKTERHAEKTRDLFHSYVHSLCGLYRYAGAREQFSRNALGVLLNAEDLGRWLDRSVFK